MKIGVVAPSRTLDPAAADLLATAAPAGFEIRIHPQCFLKEGHFAGDDAARAAAFVEVANDPATDAVWFARGGYGACRILDRVIPQLDQTARQKTYLGYSDAGFLLGALYRHGIGKPVHAPMVADALIYNDATVLDCVFSFLKDGSGVEAGLQKDKLQVAFNVEVLANLIATPYMPKLTGHIVLLEEIGEHLYALDRALFGIMNSEAMKGAAGIRLGRISRVPENDVPFGETAEQIAQRWCQQVNIPYLGSADIGHDAANKIVPFGMA